MTHTHQANSHKSGKHQVNRRKFMQGSAAVLSAAMAAKAGLFAGTAAAQSIAGITAATEASLYYRDRLPDEQTPFTNNDDLSLFDWDFPALVKSATGNGTFGTKGMPSSFSKYTEVPDRYNALPIAIIGAGAAGLAAGYELMKLGLKPCFFEMQTQDTGSGVTYARPNGRIYSWDYGGNGIKDGAGAGWYPTERLTPKNIQPVYGRNVHTWGRRVAELGGMRFPATHLTLRTYTDTIFFNDYYYGSQGLNSPWVPFRDPGLYAAKKSPIAERGGVVPPSKADTIIYDTVYHTKGVFARRDSPNPPSPGGYSQFDRVRHGTTLANSNAAIQNLTYKYFDLLFGAINGNDPYQGILTPILNLYSAYTENPNQAGSTAIVIEWQRLLNTYDTMSLGEVLTAAGWNDLPAYNNNWGDLNVSLSEMFGEIGTGTGPFAMFYYSSFMELLRIALQASDSSQDYFLGGAGYQLQPFLTHMTRTKTNTELTCLWNETQNKVITDKVVAIKKADAGSISIITVNADGETTERNFTTAIVTASPAAMRATGIFPQPDSFIPSRAMSYIKRVRINNNSKIAINFPNIIGEKYSSAFWMNRTSATDTNPNNDSIVTTLTDKTVRQIYTFDNYHWGTTYNNGAIGGLEKSGTLMLNYGWDYNGQSWTAADKATATRQAWRQMTDIYGFGTKYDDYLEWALANNQSSFIVWEKVDGFNAAWRMAQPGRATAYGNPWGRDYARYSELQTAQTFGMTSYNPEIAKYTGLFIAGEATASPGLSGWVEGSIQTGLQAVAGIIKYLNEDSPTPLLTNTSSNVSFALQALPGFNPLVAKV